MKASELRIGNFVDFEKTTHIIDEIGSTIVRSHWNGADRNAESNDYLCTINEIKPIPLTEKWLLKFGFEKHYGNVLSLETETLLIEWIDSKIYLTCGVCAEVGKEMPIKSVHQLQNLYFALTGEELTLVI